MHSVGGRFLVQQLQSVAHGIAAIRAHIGVVMFANQTLASVTNYWRSQLLDKKNSVVARATGVTQPSIRR